MKKNTPDYQPIEANADIFNNCKNRLAKEKLEAERAMQLLFQTHTKTGD